jgi:type I restriction enzyme S subunit
LFLSTFLNSAAGKAQSDQNVTGGTRPALDYATIRHFLVPLLSEAFQSQVASVVQAGHKQFDQAAYQLAAAEQTLLQALGLDTWQPPEPLTYVRRASEVTAAGRFDSVYFSPAKTESASILRRGGSKPLSAYFEPIRDMVAPLDVGAGKRVLNFDVGAATQPVIDDSSPSVEDFESAKKRFLPGDVIISRLRHYLRQIAVIRTDAAAVALGSSEFIVLRPRSTALPQEALVLFLRCLPVQTILKYSQDGSHHPRFSEEDLLAIPIPDALLTLAPQLTAAVRAAHAARREAQSLLARAQHAVEVAIEQGEPSALAYLKT